MLASHRWFLRASLGRACERLCRRVEQFKLDSLSGQKLIFRRWQELQTRLREVLAPRGGGLEETRRDAVFAYERRPLHLGGCRDDRARPLLWSRTCDERGTFEKIRGRVFSGATPDRMSRRPMKCIATFRMRLRKIARRFARATQPRSGIWRRSCSGDTARKGCSRSQ